MFNQLIETINAFSYRTVLRTNILTTPGGAFGQAQPNTSLGNGLRNQNPSQALANRHLLSNYYLKLQELKDYRTSELTRTVLTIYKDYLVGYFNDGSELIELSDTVPDKESVQAKINKILEQLDLSNEIKDHLDDYFYDGNYSIKTMWDESDATWKKFDLENPSSVVTVSEGGIIPKSYLVVSRKGQIYEVDPYSILTFGRAELDLLNDINQKYFEDTDKDEDSLIKGVSLSAGIPLYFDNSNKVKEYLLKEQILSLLSIKDLVQPLLLLLRVDGNTAPDEANKLALNVENLINKYSDISSILGTNFSIADLIDSLLNNIRVLPDNLSGMGDMNNIDLTKITGKIQEIRGDQDNTKEGILTGLSIPRSLYAGDSTKWDAIKTSQRLNSRISYFVRTLDYGIQMAGVKFYKLLTNQDIKPSNVKSKLFKKTEADYNTELTNADIVNSIFDQINRIIEGAQRSIKENIMVDPNNYAQWVKQKLLLIDPTLEDVVPDKNINEYIKQVLNERSNDAMNGGGSRYGY